MKHKLRIQRQFGTESKGIHIVGSIIGKFRTQSNERPIDPPQDITDFVTLGLTDSQTCRQDRRGFLIKRLLDGTVRHAGIGGLSFFNRFRIEPGTTESRRTDSSATIGVLIFRQELNETTFAFRKWLRITNIEIDSNRRFWINPTQGPGIRTTFAHFQIGNTRTVHLQTFHSTNRTTDFKFARGHNLESGTKGHDQISRILRCIIGISCKDALETLLEDGLTKGIS
mmetsp:Transcript_27154/g.41289  ORF Transcript_27154/g.41289 Transcript_27154/m.41289 type:complete len:226 (+) Transcript_27154:1858-2535(+)